MDLSAQSVVLELARELLVFKASQHGPDVLGWLSEHRLARHPRRNFACLRQSVDIGLNAHQFSDDCSFIGIFRHGLKDYCFVLLEVAFRLLAVRIVVLEKGADKSALHRLLTRGDLEISFDPPHDVLSLFFLGVHQQLHQQILLFSRRVVAFAATHPYQRLEHMVDCEARSFFLLYEVAVHRLLR